MGYAVGRRAKPRATKDLDVLVAGSPENLERVARALALVEHARSLGEDEVLYLGREPVRVDIMRRADGVALRGARRISPMSPCSNERARAPDLTAQLAGRFVARGPVGRRQVEHERLDARERRLRRGARALDVEPRFSKI